MNKPYRFFYTSHWISSTAEAVQQQNFYFLKPLATAANEPAIFLAPQALPGNPNGTWDTSWTVAGTGAHSSYSPAVTSIEGGFTQLFVRGNDNRLWQCSKSFIFDTFTNWAPLGGEIGLGAPAVSGVHPFLFTTSSRDPLSMRNWMTGMAPPR